MQASPEESEIIKSPSLSSDFQGGFEEVAAETSEVFSRKMKLNDCDGGNEEQVAGSDGDGDDDDDDDDFSFACIGSDRSPVSADDVFQDGQIKPVFPLFDQTLLYGGDSVDSNEDLRRRPPVRKVFIEAEDSYPPTTEEESERIEGEAAGPYCAWSRKAVEASLDVCKKSNSTGFSKIWRFRDLVNRSNSDGRDAFVFMNDSSATTSSKRDDNVEKIEGSSVKKTAGEAKGNSTGRTAKAKAMKGKKSETAPLSAHELHYVRNRASREEDRRRSYLPYKPGLVGFFTNVNGGLSRNVHPF